MQFTSYTHVVHLSKVWHKFPCQNTRVLVSIPQLYSSLYCFPMCLSTIGQHSPFFEILYPPYKIRLRSHLAYHTQVWNIKDLPSCSLVRYDYKYDSVYTPAEIRAVKYKYQKTIYFLSAFQQYIASLALKYSTYCNMVTTLTTIHPTVNRFISSPSP